MLQRIQNPTTLYEQVVEQIRSMIAEGVYRKGDMLPSEKELIAMTGVSRITVREALKTLAEVGMIETKKGKGSFVLVDACDLVPCEEQRKKQLEYRELFLDSSRTRLILEPGIAKAAAKLATAEDIEAIERSLHEPGQAYDATDRIDGFHYEVAKAAHASLLLEVMSGLLEKERAYEEQYQSFLYLVTPDHQKRIGAELVVQHRKILDAIKRHDAEFAYFYMTEHMQYVIRSYEEYFDRFYSRIEENK